MNTKAIDVVDYVEGESPEDAMARMNDPTTPFEEVDRNFMDQLAKLITQMEEVLAVGNGEMKLADIAKYIVMRGDALDSMEDPVLTAWLDNMRQTSRCPYRRFAISG